MDFPDDLVERCAKAAWDAGRCSPSWEHFHGRGKATYRRSARAVMEQLDREGLLLKESPWLVIYEGNE